MCHRTGIKGIFEHEGVGDCAFLVVVVRFFSAAFCHQAGSKEVLRVGAGCCILGWDLVVSILSSLLKVSNFFMALV